MNIYIITNGTEYECELPDEPNDILDAIKEYVKEEYFLLEDQIRIPSDDGDMTLTVEDFINSIKNSISSKKEKLNELYQREIAYYEANPDRSIFIHGEFDTELFNKHLMQIEKLITESKKPITIFIDSPGGVLNEIISLVNHLNFNEIYFISVVPRSASSAAAVLASISDYCIVYPNATLAYHGVRVSGLELTKERAISLQDNLSSSNDTISNSLANKIFERFSKRIRHYHESFNKDDVLSLIANNEPLQKLYEKSESALLCKLIAFTVKQFDYSNDFKYIINKVVKLLTTYYTILGQKESIKEDFWKNSILGTNYKEELKQKITEKSNEVVTNYDAQVKDELSDIPLYEDLPTFTAVMLNFIRLKEDYEIYTIDKDILDEISMLYLEIYKLSDNHLTDLLSRGSIRNYKFLSENDEVLETAIGKIHRELDGELLEDEKKEIKQFIEVVKPFYLYSLSISRTMTTEDYHFNAEQAYALGLIDEVKGRADLKSQSSDLKEHIQNELQN